MVVIRAAAAIAAILLATTVEAVAIDCHTSGRTGWTWREIAGRRCWYKGPRSLDKRKLQWRAAAARPRPARRHVTTGTAPRRDVERDDAEALLRDCCWPPK